MSVVATGGPPNTTNGAPCVWEPFILLHEGQLAVYYSDQRDPLYGQKLAHQTPMNLVTWGPVVNDVAYANSTLRRPGMITMAQIGRYPRQDVPSLNLQFHVRLVPNLSAK